MTLPLNEFGCVRMSGEELRAIARELLVKYAASGALLRDGRPDSGTFEALLLGELERRHPLGRLGGVAGNGAPYEDPIVSRCRDVALELGTAHETPAHDRLVGAWFAEAMVQSRRRRDGAERPVPLPWPGLASLLGGGLWPGSHVLVGAPGSGKSQLAVQVAVTGARAGHAVVYVALELGGHEVAMRAAGEISGGAWSPALRGHGLEDFEGEALAGALGQLPLTIAEGDAHGWDRDQIHACAKVAASGPSGVTGLVVLDFLQLAKGPERDLRERVTQTAYACRTAARDHSVAVLAISSAPRGMYTTTGEGTPLLGSDQAPAGAYMSAGKESGDVEFSADSLLALCRHDAGGGGNASLVVAKQRHGETGRAFLQWNGGRFTATTHE